MEQEGTALVVLIVWKRITFEKLNNKVSVQK